ncbi:MAG: nucleotidyltransferase domain-containing protein [Nanoarchaeota archaeon]|nr:nucleotidyltransferase domain-containing protein [Nanoarchaeota archaeon]
MSEHKISKENSVEQNLIKDYIPKSKLGSLPISNQMDDKLKQEMEKIQKEIELYRDEILKKYGSIESIGILPIQVSKKIEEEYEISEEDAKRNLIHILTIIPEKHFKNIGQIRLEAINIAKKINDKFWVHVMTPVDVWNLGLDSKFDILEAISMSLPVLDKGGLLGALRVSQIHKSLVLKKFEKYVTSYVISGSITRGETKKTSDIDVSIIIDDTDVKRMPRMELREKIRSIIYSYIQEAEALSGVKNKLSPQVWLLTEFWDGVKDAHPIFFSFIRDGVALYDRGTFLPWKALLRMGKIKPSPEAIDMFMSSGDKLKETVNRRILDIATLDLHYGVITPTQGLLMLYGQAPGNVYDTVKSFREIFVKKEKLVEEKYADIFEEIEIKVWKKLEHGLLKPGDIDGKELDRLSKNALDYIERLKELRNQIEKRVQEKSIEEIYKDVFGMLGSILNKKSEGEIINRFNKEYIKTGKFPPKFLESLKLISKVKGEVPRKTPKNCADFKRTIEVDNARKLASEIVNSLVEHTQRCEFLSMERTRFIIKGKEMESEVFFLKDTFVVQSSKIQKFSNGSLINSDIKELQEQLVAQKNKETKIDLKSLEKLKTIFGEFELTY